MTVHVLIPVFNRLSMTRLIIENLRRQVVDETVDIIVIDDGSTDGTSQFLSEQLDVQTLKGDGNLWWGGAIDLGLRHIFQTAGDQDWVAFVNNDTGLRSDFIQQLLKAARKYAPAAVGSVVRDVDPPHQLISVGPKVDLNWFRVTDIGVGEKDNGFSEVVEVDALSGRGVIFPVSALRASGGMRPRLLPQYLADYEVSLRVRAQGWRLLVAVDATVYSSKEFGSAYRPRNFRERYFSVRSPTYLPAQVAFWWQASGCLGRITLPLRLVLHFLTRQLLVRRR